MSNLSFVRHVGDGTNRQFTLSTAGANIGYFRTEDIHAYVNDEEVTFTINAASPHLVVLDEAPALGADVLLRREMPVTQPYANFERGNNFGHRQVNNSFIQQLYLTQEMLDGFAPEGYYLKQELNMGVHKVVNMQRASATGEAVEHDQWDEHNVVQDSRLTALEQSLTAGNLVYRRVVFTATEGQTEFNPNAVFGGILNLYVNGINQIAGEAYESVDGRIIKTVPLEEGDRVVAVIGQEPQFSEPEQTDFRYVRYPFFATGGETTYVLPQDAKQVMSLYINGAHQTYQGAFEFDVSTQTVTFAEALEGGDEVVIYAGSEPVVEGDASNLPVTSEGSAITRTLRSWAKRIVDVGTGLVTSVGSSVSRTLENRFGEVVNVLDFGADPTGVVSSSAAFKAASAYAADAARNKRIIDIPAGTYLLDEAGSMTTNVSGVTNGLTWRGAGLGVTVINFINSNPVADNYLIENDDHDLRVNIRGIRFQGNATDENSKFYKLTSAGTAQSIRFWDCMWYQFYSIMEIHGTANASELLYVGCKTSNIYGKAYTCDNVQSVNHNFYGCDFEVHFDDVFYFTKGGVLNFYGGSIILNDHPTKGTSGAVIHTIGGSSVIGSGNWNYTFWGIRTELHGTSMLLSQQSAGKIAFNDCNLDVITGDKTRFLTSINESGWVKIDGGHVNGHFRLITSNSSGYATPWRNAELNVENATLGSAFQVSRTSVANSGGIPRWRIRGCKRSQNSASITEVWDEDNGFDLGYSGQAVHSKYAVLCRHDGNLPKDGQEYTLHIPNGAILKSVRLYHLGQAGQTNLTYRLRNSNGTKTYGTWTFNATDTVDTVGTAVESWLRVGSIDRVLKLTSSGVTGYYKGYVVVEYI